MNDNGGGWLSRTPSHPSVSRKRDRQPSSHDDAWASYEARGSGGGMRRFARPPGRMDRNDITAAGARVGMGHDPGQQRQQQGRQGGSNWQQGHGSNQSRGPTAGGTPSNPYGAPSRPAGDGGGGGPTGNVAAAGSRIRVADYRGAAARVGALPSNDGPPPSVHRHDPSFRGGGGPANPYATASSGGVGKDGAHNVALFRNPAFLQSLAHPPPVSVHLPPALRSTLNDAQCRVVESVLSGHSTFFTGPAGSGKSHVLSTLLKANESGIGMTGRPRKIVVTATTGVAACNVGGITVHSFAGVGAGNASLPELAKRVMGNEYTKGRWREVDVLVIDEISMMAGSFLDKLGFIAQRARNDRRPFGGVQVVVCGDFFQLPPVELSKDGFAFEAKCWAEVISCSVLLKEVFRQRGDATLMTILDEARIGELSPQSAGVLRRHGTLPAAAFGASRTMGDDDDAERVVPTLLECRNRDVDRANEREMAKLPGKVVTFASRDRAVTDGYKAQLRHCSAPERLDLKVGAQVMLLKNIDLERGLANGSRGVVVGFQRPKSEGDVPTGFKKMEFPVVKFDAVKAVGKAKEGDDDDKDDDDNEFTIHPEEWTNKMGDQTVSSRVQIPLRLAWSISVHKSQGMTIPNLTVNLAGVFEYGQAYVALSRATELKLLTLRGFSEKSFRAHPKVKTFYNLLDSGGSLNLGPATGKENVGTRPPDDCIGDLCDPFEGDPTLGGNPYGSGSRNPYSQRKPPPASSHPHQQHYGRPRQPPPVQTTGRFSPMPAPRPPPHSAVSLSPNLTEDQRRRMEENRKRALAIRMQKQNNAPR